MPLPIKTITYLVDACWLVFLVYWLAKAAGNKKNLYPREHSGMRLLVVILAFLAAWLTAKHYYDTPILPYTLATQIFGVGLCAIGVGWAIWARSALGTNWSANPTIKEGHELIQTGPYAITRHPIYTGVMLAIIGTFLSVIPTWFGFGLVVLGMVSLYFKLRKEERLMMQTFPQDYPAYKQRVRAALVPYLF